MIKIICLGKIKEKYLCDLIEDYSKRITKYHKIQIIQLKDDNDINKETFSILKQINSKDYVIGLCIDAQQMDSVEFAKMINQTFIHHSCLTFIIGSTNGLSSEVIKRCNFSISFSKMTFTHGMFRAILLEQIYRAFKINNNQTYHK